MKKEKPDLLKITKNDDTKTLEHKADKHEYENISNPSKIDKMKYKRNCIKINKKSYMTTLENLVGISGVTVGTSLSLTGVGSCIDVFIAG